MATNTTFWQRVGSLLRGGSTRVNSGDGHGNGPPAMPGDPSVPDVLDDPPRPPSALMRWGRRGNHSDALRAEYHRVAALLDSLEDHFRNQDERTRQLADSVTQVAANLASLADSQRSQGDWIRSIAAQTEAAGQTTRGVAETLRQVPPLLDAQLRASQSMATRLEASSRFESELTTSLQSFGQAVDSLRTSSATQVETLQRLHASEREQRAALTSLVREQGRRFLIIIGVAAVLGVVALAVLSVTIWLLLQR